MEPIYNDSFTAEFSDEGLRIEEKSKGPLKMLLIFSGISVAAIALSFVLVGLGGLFGRIVGPALFWGGAVVIVISLVAIILKVFVQNDRSIWFDNANSTLHLRGKDIAYSSISDIDFQVQELFGKQGCFVFMRVNGKKKSLFSTSVIVKDPQEIKILTDTIKQMVEGKPVEAETSEA